MGRKQGRGEGEDVTPSREQARGTPEHGLPEFGARHRELLTQGQRLKWVRYQIGDDMWTPKTREDLAPLLAQLSGEKERSPTTIFRWENDEGSPSLKEAVVYARLCGRSVEWLAALDLYIAAQNPTSELSPADRATILAQGHHRGTERSRKKGKPREPLPRAVPGGPGVDVTPKAQPHRDRKRGNDRGRRR